MATVATQFPHGRSEINAAILTAAATERGCTCVPYEDWFTLKRWNAQGFRVQRGQKSTRLKVLKPRFEEVDGKKQQVGKSCWTACLFCRCQVKPEGDDNGKTG